MKLSIPWMEHVVGAPDGSGIQHRVLNLLIFVAFLSGVVFFVSDSILSPDPAHFVYELGMALVFGLLYWQSRFRHRYRFVAHVGTLAVLAFFSANFFINGGIVGPTLMVLVMALSFVTLVHPLRIGLGYFLIGSGLSVIAVFLQAAHPEWISPYASPEAQFWDISASFGFCLVLSFVVMRMVIRFFQDSLQRTREDQAVVAQTEKMAALGEMTANLAHEIKSPVSVIGSALWLSESWWKEEAIRTAEILERLSPEQVVAYWGLLKRGLSETGEAAPDHRSERTLRAALQREMEAQGIADAGVWAEELVSLNLVEWEPQWAALVSDEPGRAALTHALRTLTVDRSNRNAQAAYESLGGLVAALGSYARSDRPEERPVPTRLEDGLETVLTLYGAGHKRTIEIVRNFQEIPLLVVKPDELIQVWTNLVQNALQAMNGQGTLTVSLEAREPWVVVTFSDTGPGVPLAIRDKIFAPFFTTKQRGQGTGLGLGIVMRIVTAHGGQVEVKDAPGGGAAFVVRLPLVSSYS